MDDPLQYALFYEHSLEGFAYCRMLYDDAGRPDDFVFLAVNPAYLRLTGFTDVVGRRFTEFLPRIREEAPQVLTTYGLVAQTGEPAVFETSVPALGLRVQVSAMSPRPGHFIAAIRDVTARWRAEEDLRRSEARYRGYFEQGLVAIAVLSPDGRLVDTNQAACDLLGYTRDELLARTWSDLLHVDDVAAHAQRLRALSEGDADAYRADKRLMRRGGGTVYADVSMSLRRHTDGSPADYLALFLDVSDRHRLEADLDDERRRFRQLVENSGEAFLLTRPDGTTLFANPAACRMFRRSEEELLAIGRAGIVDPSDPRLTEILRERETSGGFSGQLRYLRGDGTTFDGEVVSSTYTDQSGTHLASVVIRDLTEQKAAEAEILCLNAMLAGQVASRTEQRDAATRELEAFAYSVAHDVRSPLRTIDGFSQLVLDDDGAVLSPSSVEHLQRSRAAAQHMARLLDELAGLTRVSRQELLRSAVDVSAVAQTVAAELAGEQPDRVVDVQVAPGLAADADPQLVRLILRELLGNAWKFTRRQPVAHVAVGAVDCDDGPGFFVRDDGVGFDMRHAAHLYGVFQRMHPQGEYEGDGVGLATVQRLVARHGGRVWAEAAPDEGATFAFTLPSTSPPAP